eukprot:Amastigsp_a342729_6.p4 type:complete len:119 gc:universal Amastigsp_a342729_6:223-579(+)
MPHAGVSSHAGMVIAKESGRVAAVALSSRENMCSAIAFMTSSTKGGLASNEPSSGARSKNEPCDPKCTSVSGNAEQNELSVALSGEAKHSCVTPRVRPRISNRAAGSAAWYDAPPTVS